MTTINKSERALSAVDLALIVREENVILVCCFDKSTGIAEWFVQAEIAAQLSSEALEILVLQLRLAVRIQTAKRGNILK